MTLDDISNLISIATPLILLVWFYYSQRATLSKDYFAELAGIYGGFLEATYKPREGETVHAGIILNIRDVDNKGYFKGDFDYAETLGGQGMQLQGRNISDGVYQFFGEMKFELHLDKKRHPFDPAKNRTYKGKLFVVDRLDFRFDDYKIEQYVRAEYNIVHYREMETLKFTLSTVHRTGAQELPAHFLLYKSAGFDFEPYKSVKKVVFPVQTRVDR
jgi:hypothetical protein